MKYALIGLSAALLLAGCGADRSAKYSEVDAEMGYAGGAPAIMSESQDQLERITPAPPSPPSSPAPEAAEQYIAYTYAMGIRLPVAQVDPLMQAHIDACNTAGPTRCIVTNSSLNKQSEEIVSGNLYIRAVPEWIDTFMDGVDAETEAAKGEISYRNASAEDLTRAILDTGARLKAQETLQARLQNLLETRDGELKDLLEIERELARVSGGIDSIRSNLKAMRLRVSMSQLSINYETKRKPFTQATVNPIARAGGDFFYNFSAALAAVIDFFAVGLPWMFLVGAFAWIWLKLIWPRLRRKKKI